MSTVPGPDDEPASRRDVSDSAQVLRGEMESLRGELASLRGEIQNLGVRMDAEFVAVRGEMAAQGGRLLGQMWLSSFAASATAGGLVLAAVTLG